MSVDRPSSHPAPDTLGGSEGQAYHLAESRLVDFVSGRFGPAERESIQLHLESCSDCRELEADVRLFLETPRNGEEEVAVDKAAGWSALRGRLAQEGWFEERRARHLQRVRRALLAAAASVALAVAGVYGYLWGGAEIRVLVPVDAYRGGGPKVEGVRLPATLLLRATEVRAGSVYEALILDATRREVASWTALRPDGTDQITLKLRRFKLQPGDYQVVLRDRSDAKARPGEFALRIAAR